MRRFLSTTRSLLRLGSSSTSSSSNSSSSSSTNGTSPTSPSPASHSRKSSTSHSHNNNSSPSPDPSQLVKIILQRLPFAIHVLVGVFAWFGPQRAPVVFSCLIVLVHAGLIAFNGRAVYASSRAGPAVLECSKTDWRSKLASAATAEMEGLMMTNASASGGGVGNGNGMANGMGMGNGMGSTGERVILKGDEVIHVVVIPNYKEDEGVLRETLATLASHPFASRSYIPVLAMEAREKGSALKAERLVASYSSSFLDICYTVHPDGLPNDAPGKSSNVSWAAHSFVGRQDERDWMFSVPSGSRGWGQKGWRSRAVFTVVDSDTAFAADYFDCVSYQFGTASLYERKRMMFTPPICFDRNEREVAAPVRVTDITWALAGMSTTYNGSSVKIPTSAYSISMALAQEVGGWDADANAIGEDMHMLIKAMLSTGGNLVMRSVYSPASQLNVHGTYANGGYRAWVSDYQARYMQALRHLWGSLDVGYVVGRFMNGSIGCSMNKTTHFTHGRGGPLYYAEKKQAPLGTWSEEEDHLSTSPTTTQASDLASIEEEGHLTEDTPMTAFHGSPSEFGFDEKTSFIPAEPVDKIRWFPILVLVLRTWEACIMLGNVVTFIIVRGINIAVNTIFGITPAPYKSHAKLLAHAFFWTDRARDAAFLCVCCSVLFYHRYHRTASIDRWVHDSANENPRLGGAPGKRSKTPVWRTGAEYFLLFPLSIPFGPFAMLQAQFMHLFTNKLTYTVSLKLAAKPLLVTRDAEKRPRSIVV